MAKQAKWFGPSRFRLGKERKKDMSKELTPIREIAYDALQVLADDPTLYDETLDRMKSSEAYQDLKRKCAVLGKDPEYTEVGNTLFAACQREMLREVVKEIGLILAKPRKEQDE